MANRDHLDITIHLSPLVEKLLVSQHGELIAAINTINKGIDKMDADIQKSIDEIAEIKTVAASLPPALALLNDQIAAQTTMITDLQSQIAAGGTVSAADLEALRTANADLAQTIVELRAAIPAGTPNPTPLPSTA